MTVMIKMGVTCMCFVFLRIGSVYVLFFTLTFFLHSGLHRGTGL